MTRSNSPVSRDHWEQLEPFQRWLYLQEREALDTRRSRLLSRSSQVRLSQRHLSTDIMEMRVDGYLPSSSTFFRSFYKSILTELPFQNWIEVFQNGGGDLISQDVRQAGIRHFRQLAARWVAMLSGGEQAADSFTGWLSDCLSWKKQGMLELESWKLPLVGVNLEAVTLSSQIPLHVTLLSRDHPESLAANEIRYLQDLLSKNNRPRLIINVAVGDRGRVGEYRANLAPSDDELIILDERRVKRIFLDQRYSETVQAVLQEDLGLLRMNPYSTEKPVPRSNMFFGRQNEIDAILHHPEKDFMVVGSRQIGKSSLCKQLQRILSHENRKTIFVDASMYQSADDFFGRLAYEINEHRVISMTTNRFPQIVRAACATHDCKYVFLIDEVDRLLETATKSADWRVFQVLRELSQDQVAQAVFTGHRTLYEHYRNLKSPLYNFTSRIVLSRLDKKSAVRLIKEPMRALDISFKTSDERRVIDHIVNQTGCFPSFLQCFCHELVKQVAKRSERSRNICWEDVRAVHAMKQFRDFILKPFNHEENLTLLERLIVMELALGVETEFTFSTLLHVIDRHDLSEYSDELVHSLENLEVAGLIESELPTNSAPWRAEEANSLTFRVTIPALPNAIKQSRDVGREIAEIVGRLRLSEVRGRND